MQSACVYALKRPMEIDGRHEHSRKSNKRKWISKSVLIQFRYGTEGDQIPRGAVGDNLPLGRSKQTNKYTEISQFGTHVYQCG